jgi:tripartite-type tricarboxylate transporter receptor subunit TctC
MESWNGKSWNGPIGRRTLLQGGAAALGGAALATAPLSPTFAQAFPSENLKVMVATREGGGADRNLRALWSVWKKYLKTEMEASFYPGGAGRVGYEKYMGIAKPDCYTLLFGNMGPEVLNWVVQPPAGFKFPDDYVYFNRVDVDPSCIFVDAKKSPFKTIDDIVAEGKKRTLNVAVSRIAHPTSLGILAIGRQAGAKFNLVPLSGGRNTYAGVSSGEMDIGALPLSGVAARHTTFRTVLVFDDEPYSKALTEQVYDAPRANKHFGMKLPDLHSARAFAIKTEAIEKHPDRFKTLVDTAAKVFKDPEFKVTIEKTKAPWELVRYGDREQCAKYVKEIVAIGEEYKDLIKGKA